MTIQATFAEELPGFQYADDGLLSLFRNNGHFYLAGLDIEDVIRRISLSENDPAPCEIQDRFARPHESEKCLGIKQLLLFWLFHKMKGNCLRYHRLSDGALHDFERTNYTAQRSGRRLSKSSRCTEVNFGHW